MAQQAQRRRAHAAPPPVGEGARITTAEQRAVLETARTELAKRWPATPIAEHDVFQHWEDEALGFGPLYRACACAIIIAPFRFQLSLRWNGGEPAKTLRAVARSHDDDAQWALFPDRATRDAFARHGFATSYDIAADLEIEVGAIVDALAGFAATPMRIVRGHEVERWPRWAVWEAIAAERFDVLGEESPGRWLTARDNNERVSTILGDDDLAMIRAWRHFDGYR